MNKIRNLSITILAASLFIGCSETERTIEYPIVDIYSTGTLDISKIDITDSSTVIHFSAMYIPKYWIRLDKNSYIKAGGVKLPATGSGKLILGEKFYIPENGRDTFFVTFPPIPKGTKSIDFMEAKEGDAFRLYGIDLTGKKKHRPFKEIPKKLLEFPDRNIGLPEVRLNAEKSTVNMHFLGYRPELGHSVELYVKSLLFGQKHPEMQIDTITGTASLECLLCGPAEMSSVRPEYLDFIVSPGETVDIYMDLYAASDRVRKKHFPEISSDIKDRPSVYFDGYYSALNYYLNNESRDELPFPPFLDRGEVDYRWSDAEFADRLLSNYRNLCDSITSLPVAESVKEFYINGMKSSALFAAVISDELRRSSYMSEHGHDSDVPKFNVLDSVSRNSIADIINVNDSSLAVCTDNEYYLGILLGPKEFSGKFFNDESPLARQTGKVISIVSGKVNDGSLSEKDLAVVDSLGNNFLSESYHAMYEDMIK